MKPIFNEKVELMFVGSVNSAQIHCSWLTWSTRLKQPKKKKADLKRKRHFSTIQTAP